MSKKILWPGFLMHLTLFFSFVTSAWAAPVELKQGRYIGWIKFGHNNQRLAVVSDFFLESPEDLTQFPKLKSIVKLSLGGYNTHEYLAESFENLHYDFDNGNLTFDEPDNDLVISSQVKKVGLRTKIVGDLFVRSSMSSGTLDLTLEDDEPGDDNEDHLNPRENQDGPFVPLLDGQYEGICDGRKAAFQIQTLRRLKTPWQDSDQINGLGKSFGIVGRIGFKDQSLCGDLGPQKWCTLFDYSAGSYNFYTGKLLLQGPHGANVCDLSQGLLQCQIRIQGAFKSCSFQKRDLTIKTAHFYSRKFHVVASAAQKEPLPEPSPPANSLLSSDLKGTFTGYLHNETNDIYQVVRLTVTPYSSTNNPHNPNQMMISSTAAVHFESDTQGPFFSQRYETRSFYLRPGFTLLGPHSDSYIGIQEWKRGYIRGVWYSRAFGRVGTVELVKSDLPPLDRRATVMNSFSGEFEARIGSTETKEFLRWVKFVFPTNPNEMTENIIGFSGAYQSVVGISAVKSIEKGAFDPYTGGLGWKLSKGEEATTFVTGRIGNDKNAYLYWPSVPKVFGAITSDYAPQKYERK